MLHNPYLIIIYSRLRTRGRMIYRILPTRTTSTNISCSCTATNQRRLLHFLLSRILMYPDTFESSEEKFYLENADDEEAGTELAVVAHACNHSSHLSNTQTSITPFSRQFGWVLGHIMPTHLSSIANLL